jgi:hypothetical protein
MRRTVLLAATLFLIAPSAPVSTSPSRTLDVPDGFTFAAVGDLLEARPIVPLHDPAFERVDALITSSNVAFGNGEMPLIDVDAPGIYPQAENGGSNIYGIPAVAHDLKAQGFTMVSRANNHSTDWGVDGMNMTDALFDAAGIMHAGTGRDETAARATRFVETPWGRMGLAATTTTFEGMEPAGAASQDVAARPGASVLHTVQSLAVDRATLEGLKRYYGAPVYHEDDTVTADAITVYGQRFEIGTKPGITYAMDKHDLAEILQGVRQGSAISNFLVFSIHCHESASGVTNDIPQGAFLRDFAHDVIDAGADVFIGHGPHQVGGIEIYKGKPIFYSLGNYIFQLNSAENTYPEGFRQFNLDPIHATDTDYWSSMLHHYFAQSQYWQSVVAVMTYRHDAVATIRLYPIDLREAASLATRGIPAPASHDEAVAILARIQALSAPYHTHIDVENDVGIIHVQ